MPGEPLSTCENKTPLMAHKVLWGQPGLFTTPGSYFPLLRRSSTPSYWDLSMQQSSIYAAINQHSSDRRKTLRSFDLGQLPSEASARNQRGASTKVKPFTAKLGNNFSPNSLSPPRSLPGLADEPNPGFEAFSGPLKWTIKALNKSETWLFAEKRRCPGPSSAAELATITALSLAKLHQQLPLIEFVESNTNGSDHGRG